MLKFAEDTAYSNTVHLIRSGEYPNDNAIREAGFKINEYDVVLIPKNTPFKYLGTYDGKIHLEVFGEVLLFNHDEISAIVS